jgi:hypothetical protein
MHRSLDLAQITLYLDPTTKAKQICATMKEKSGLVKMVFGGGPNVGKKNPMKFSFVYSHLIWSTMPPHLSMFT